MSAIPTRLKQVSTDSAALAEAWEALEAERDWYKRQAVRWAEEAERLNPSLAVREFLLSHGRHNGVPIEYSDIPIG